MLNSLFLASLMLFIIKLNSSLCFYINYYKLNSLTKKIVLVFFINKTLA
jgi:hypothetical protein